MIEQRIRARVGAYSVPAVVHAVQGDTGRVFVFELEDYTVTGNEGASLNCMRPDGSFYTYAGTVSAEDNTVTVALDVEGGALTQEGVVTFQLELTEAGLIVCTFRGSIIVEPVVGGEATQEEKDFRDAIQAQLNNKASNAQLAQVESELTDRINGVSDDLAQEILDREAADATKANKSTTINGKDLSADRVIYAQDVPSKNLLPNTETTRTINGITYTVNTDGTITANGTATIDSEFTVELPSNANTLQTGNYILSGCASGGSNTTYYALLWDRTTNARAKAWDGTTASGNDVGGGVGVQVVQGHAIAWDLIIKSGQTVSNLTFRPMIRLASIEDDSYVPYAMTNIELSPKVIAPTATVTRGNINRGSVVKCGKICVINIVFTAVQSASNSPSCIRDLPLPICETALSVIDITSGIGTEITSAVPCGVSQTGILYIKEIVSGHVYAITGTYMLA